MLAAISLETEFKIHEVIISLLHFQAADKFCSSGLGFEIVPSTNPSLFLPDKAIIIALLQDP